MCREGASPEEIVEFFKTFVSSKMKIEIYMKNFLKNHKTSDKVGLFKYYYEHFGKTFSKSNVDLTILENKPTFYI